MGKRKAKSGLGLAETAARKRARGTLPSRFECPFCNHKGAVSCTLNREEGRATAACRHCGMSYATSCRMLTEPVDVYHEWLDSCEEHVEQQRQQQQQAGAAQAAPGGGSLRGLHGQQQREQQQQQQQQGVGQGPEERYEGVHGVAVADALASISPAPARKQLPPPQRRTHTTRPADVMEEATRQHEEQLGPAVAAAAAAAAAPQPPKVAVRRRLVHTGGAPVGPPQPVSPRAVAQQQGGRDAGGEGRGVPPASLTPTKRQSELQRQQAALRAWGSEDDADEEEVLVVGGGAGAGGAQVGYGGYALGAADHVPHGGGAYG